MRTQGRRHLPAAPTAAVTVALLVAMLAATLATAHVSTRRDATNLKQTFAVADAVIHGVVSDVQYRMSTRQGEGGESLPHTFVTYEVRSQLHGKVPGRTVTLRFIGGPDGTGRFLTVSGVPLFQKGHEDVLFIKDNGRASCPLVNCEDGRIRVHQGRVYNARALPIIAVEKNEVLRTGANPEPALQKYAFPAPSFDNLMKRREVAEKAKGLGDAETVKKRYEAEAPKSIEYSVVTAPPAKEDDKAADTSAPGIAPSSPAAPDAPLAADRQGPPMTADVFLNTMKTVARGAPKRPDQVVASVDPDKPFSVRLPTPMAPKKTTVAPKPRAAEKPDERREREALEKQDFDPVIRK